MEGGGRQADTEVEQRSSELRREWLVMAALLAKQQRRKRMQQERRDWGWRGPAGDACLPTSGSNKAGPRCGLGVATPEADNRHHHFICKTRPLTSKPGVN